jgi:hypothetical protein
MPLPLPKHGPGFAISSSAVMLDLMSEVTRILIAIEQGDPLAAEQLLPLGYDELRQYEVGRGRSAGSCTPRGDAHE